MSANVDVSAPVIPWIAVLTTGPAATLLSRCDEQVELLPDRYRERLYDTAFVRATGLRAPPSL
ncbi:MAG: hypothetical protein LBL78_02060 [Prevotellaceae bacterium]|nr:hypothetical protein [Prevotellaceae bacterium]